MTIEEALIHTYNAGPPPGTKFDAIRLGPQKSQWLIEFTANYTSGKSVMSLTTIMAFMFMAGYTFAKMED